MLNYIKNIIKKYFKDKINLIKKILSYLFYNIKKIIVFYLLLNFFILFSCSSVFRASLTGKYIDSETGNGINDGYVFLYTEENNFKEDWNNYQKNSNYLIFFNNCFTSITTSNQGNESGVFNFNAIVWKTLFPNFGKDADIMDIILVFYHEDYGVSYTRHRIISDSTTRIPPIKVERIKNSAIIRGKIIDISSGEGIPNVSVNIYVPESWSFDVNGDPIVNDSNFNNKPTYTVLTDSNGNYSIKISFPKVPNLKDDKKKTKVRVLISLTDYETSSNIDSNLTDNTSWDPDGNGIYEDYYQSFVINKDATVQLPPLKMRKLIFTESINGVVKLSGSGVNGYKVKITYKTRNNEQTSKTTRTYTFYPNNQTSIPGYFEIQNIELYPDGVEGNQNYQDIKIEVYDSMNNLKTTINNFRIYENADNYIEINI
ncbi:MAG: carboxypeptidase-like regulatory domain-containing protein [Spirochaetes bacterium]|nr:carboxypeptidase-like regulatory domain-containing protein [Spirochaetota bacterium]